MARLEMIAVVLATGGLMASPARAQNASSQARPGAPEILAPVAERPKPPPLHVDYMSYGAGATADILADSGAGCREDTPCIFGNGGGLVVRGGYHSPGPWYVGGAYQISKTNSSNLYRLATLQQLRAEMRYTLQMDFRTSPYATWGIGGVTYGNEWGVETGGGTAFLGLGFESQLSRLASIGLAFHYQPMVFAGFTDTADFDRDPGMVQYLRLELKLEIRSEVSRK